MDCRHRLTASYIELLLSFENTPRHRLLTGFVETMSNFTLMDAKDLEDKEGPMTSEMRNALSSYGELISGKRLFEPGSEYETIFVVWMLNCCF
jgi:hypothetical protein